MPRKRNDTHKRHYKIMIFKSAPDTCDIQEAVSNFNIILLNTLKNFKEEKRKRKKNGLLNNLDVMLLMTQTL